MLICELQHSGKDLGIVVAKPKPQALMSTQLKTEVQACICRPGRVKARRKKERNRKVYTVRRLKGIPSPVPRSKPRKSEQKAHLCRDGPSMLPGSQKGMKAMYASNSPAA